MQQYQFTRERRQFGRQCNFIDETKLMFSINPSNRLRTQYVLRNPVDRGTQLSSQFASSDMQSLNAKRTDHGVSHTEGGWPREVNIHDEESTQRYRKKIEREDNYGIKVSILLDRADTVALQNSAINIYEDFFVDLSPELAKNIWMPFEGRQCNIFHDVMFPHRRVALIDFLPSDKHKFLAQHSNPDDLDEITGVEETVKASLNAFFVWNTNDALKPAVVLDAGESVRRAMYCQKDESIIAGGLESGKVAVWNAANGGMPKSVSPLEAAHREQASAFCWVHSKTNSEFYTGSYDGSIKCWDARDLEDSLYEVLLDPEPEDEQKRERAHGVTVLEFEYTIPVRFIMASDQGHIFIGNRKGYTPTEILVANYKLFSGPVRTIERNPFFVKNFLIVADWCAKIWAEECKGAPTTLLVRKKNEMLCGTWSPSRCSLYVTGDLKGELDFWDLLLSHREPIFTMTFKHPVTCVQFRPDGKYLNVGLLNGDVHVLELDAALKLSNNKEKALIMALFEREQFRNKLLEGRVEEMKLKRKTAMESMIKEQDEKSKPVEPLPNYDVDDPDQFLQLIESDTEFKTVLKEFKDITHAIDKKRQERPIIMELTVFEEEEAVPEHEEMPEEGGEEEHEKEVRFAESPGISGGM